MSPASFRQMCDLSPSSRATAFHATATQAYPKAADQQAYEKAMGEVAGALCP